MVSPYHRKVAGDNTKRTPAKVCGQRVSQSTRAFYVFQNWHERIMLN